MGCMKTKQNLLFLAAFALALPTVRGQETVGPALFEGRPAKEAAERAAAMQPPSLGLSLTPPIAAVLPPLTADEVERMRPKQGLTPIGVHRQLPKWTAARSFAAGTSVAGAWQATAAGWLWRLRITSPDARALRIHFQDFDVDAGNVWVHGADGRVYGPYGGRGMYGDGDFWSDIVSGAGATIEYLPASAAAWEGAAPFRIAAVSHIRGIPGFFEAVGPPSPSTLGPCFVNVSCDADWSDTFKLPGEYAPSSGVAKIVFAKGEHTYECSGALLRDKLNSGTPYFLTAAHCINSGRAARSMIAYWFYELACDGAEPSRGTSTRGAYFLTSFDGALDTGLLCRGEICPRYGGDTALLRLVEPPPAGASFLPLAVSGRNYPSIGDIVTGIHHPFGDYKRISFGRITGTRHKFYQLSWSRGQSAPGSSGSPLFNGRDGSGRIVGVSSYAREGINRENACLSSRSVGYDDTYWFARYIRPYTEAETVPPLPPGGPLTPGQPARFSMGPRSNITLFRGTHSFRLDVPENASRVTFAMNAGSADVDLYVRYGRDIGFNSDLDGYHYADHRSTSYSGSEKIVITRDSNPPLLTGTYFVALELYDEDVLAVGALTATLEYGGRTSPPGRLLTHGQPARFRRGPVNTPTLYRGSNSYRLDVPRSASRVTFELRSDNPSEDVDLYVRYGRDIGFNSDLDGYHYADHRSTSSSGNETIVITRDSTPPLRTGTYFAALELYDEGVVASGTLTATLDPPPRPPPTPPTVSLTVRPSSIQRGESATLRWSSANAESVRISPGVGTVAASGSRRVSPTASTTYRITAKGAGGSAADSARVTVTEPAPVISSTNGIRLATGTPVVSYISPLALISVFGQDFAPDGTRELAPRLGGSGRVASNLAGVCLEIEGRRAPLFAVTPNQINAQVPVLGFGGSYVDIEVIRGCGAANPQRSRRETVLHQPASPAFFNFTNDDPDGRNPVVALHGGGPALAGPPGLISGLELTPAEPGEVVSLFGSGFGATEPPLEAGQIPARVLQHENGLAHLRYSFSFAIGGFAVPVEDVLYAGTAPCCAGLYQFVLRVPRGVSGNAQVMAKGPWTGISTPEGPYLSVR